MKVTTLLFLKGNDSDQILLAMKKRGFGAGRWNGVGGKVEVNETVEQALIRECEEEIGVTPTKFEKVAEHYFVFPEGLADIKCHVFMASEWKNDPIETEEMAPKWFHIDNIPYDDMWQDDIVWLPLTLRGKYLKTRFRFNEQEEMHTAELEILPPDALHWN